MSELELQGVSQAFQVKETAYIKARDFERGVMRRSMAPSGECVCVFRGGDNEAGGEAP